MMDRCAVVIDFTGCIQISYVLTEFETLYVPRHSCQKKYCNHVVLLLNHVESYIRYVEFDINRAHVSMNYNFSG